MDILLLVTLSFIVGWQLVKIAYTNCQKYREFKIAQKQLQQYAMQIGDLSQMQEQNRIAHNFYDTLGQSIVALNIQLQVAHKLWYIDPNQAQHSLSEAYQLSSTLMQELRQAVKKLNQDT
ncbi:histidine kinase [Scytonema sp. NUACC21]